MVVPYAGMMLKRCLEVVTIMIIQSWGMYGGIVLGVVDGTC